MDDGGVQEIKVIPLWARIISWIFGSVITIIAILIFIIGSWSLGSSMLSEIKAVGILESLVTLGIGALIMLFSATFATIFVIILRRLVDGNGYKSFKYDFYYIVIAKEEK